MSVFVSFEGIDLSGKSTQVEMLEDFLRSLGRDVVSTREPGGTGLGEAIRTLLLHGEHVHQWAEAALFAAARAQLVHEIIQPSLDAGMDVLCDRFIDSSLAYQGVGRGLGIEHILEMNHAAIGDLLPSLSFVMLLAPEDAHLRMPAQLSLIASGRGNVGPPDRIEREAIDFKHRVDAGYRLLIERFSDRLIPLDATQPPETIARIVRERVVPLL